MGKFVAFFILMAGLVSCKNNASTADQNNAVVSTEEAVQQKQETQATPQTKTKSEVKVVSGTAKDLKFDGQYRAVLPCSGCVGVKTKVILSNDGTYQLYELFIGKNEEPKITTGSYAVEGDQFEIKGSESTLKFRIGKSSLYLLDENGNIPDLQSHVFKFQ